MSASINLHGIKKVKAEISNGTSWLEMENRAGVCVYVFMPYDTAKAMADDFNADKENEHDPQSTL